MTDRHAWFRVRLEAHLSGLLDEVEGRAFAEHAAGCESCATWLAEYAADAEPAADAGHLSAGVLAAWPRAVGELGGLERRLVRRHLERCAECRQELELLGHAPRLASEAGPGHPAAVGVAGAGTEAGGERRVIVLRREVGRRWDKWYAWSGWAAAAVVLAATLLAPPRSSQPPPVARATGDTLAPPIETPPTDAETGGSAAGLAIPIHLEGTMRTGGPAVTRVRLPEGVFQIAVAIPAPDIPDSAKVHIRLLDRSGVIVDERVIRNSDLFGNTLLLLGRPGRPLAEGRHRLVVRGDPGPGALVPGDVVREFELDFVRR